MVIQITPHTEPAQVAQGIPEAESPQKIKPEKDGLGVFAKLLAGLSGRGLSGHGLTATAEEGATGAELPGDALLAEEAQSADLQMIAKDKGKGTRTGKIAQEAAIAAAPEKNGAIKTKTTGDIEPEPVEFGLSEQEMNLLFSVGRLVGQPEEDISGEESAKLAIEADSESDSLESIEAIFARLAEGAALAQAEKQTATASSMATGELAQNRKNPVEKTKSQGASAETLAFDRQATQELANDAFLRQAEAKKAVGSEKEGRNRLEEARNRDRRRVATLEVRDFRSTGATAESTGKDGAVQIRVGAESRMPSGAGNREVTLELRLTNQGQEAPSAQNSWEAKASQAFESMLARELHQNFNNDIVRHASVMLRDNNEGTIRLALKPESLGNVKISLEMVENKITGHIVVESEEALRAFEREIASLEKAFRDSGFEGADLEMSLAADGREQQQWQETEASRSLPWQFAASRYDETAEQMEIPLTLDVYRHGARAINMLA